MWLLVAQLYLTLQFNEHYDDLKWVITHLLNCMVANQTNIVPLLVILRPMMERWLSIEAKAFCFSSKEGFSNFRMEERKKNFVGYIYASTQCSSWVVDTVEAACHVNEDVAKSYREGDKV